MTEFDFKLTNRQIFNRVTDLIDSAQALLKQVEGFQKELTLEDIRAKYGHLKLKALRDYLNEQWRTEMIVEEGWSTPWKADPSVSRTFNGLERMGYVTLEDFMKDMMNGNIHRNRAYGSRADMVMQGIIWDLENIEEFN